MRRYREPIVRAHPLTIRNSCPVALEIRLVYRTSRGYEQLPNGQVWTITPGTTTGPLNDVGGRQLAVTDDEVYYNATDPTGAWTFTHPLSRPYNGTQMAVAQYFASLENDRYVVAFTCRESTPTPPPPPPPPPTRGLVIRNECSDRLEIRLIYRTPSGYTQPHGEVWTVPGNITTVPLVHRGETLQLVSNEVYYQVNGPNGPWTIERQFDADYNGTPLRMGQLLASIGTDGNYFIRFTC